MSPLASVKACLQSIIGAPVFSRRSFTCVAEIFTVVVPIRVSCFAFLVSSVSGCYRHFRPLKTGNLKSIYKTKPAPGRSLVKTRAGLNSKARFVGALLRTSGAKARFHDYGFNRHD